MALNRDSLQTIIERIDADIAANLPNYVVGLNQSVERVLAKALAGVAHGLHGHIVYLSKQIFPDTAEGEYLERMAGVYGIERDEGARGTGTFTLYTNVAGVTVPAGTVWLDPVGTRFTQDADATSEDLGGGLYGKAGVAITAVEIGASGNVANAVSLTIESPQINVTGDAVSQGISGAADEETDDQLLTRLLIRLRTPPRGGAEADYVAWALEVSGVTRAWAIAKQFGVGTVGVCFVRDNETPIIPDSGEVTAVQDYIDALKPATAEVTVFAPTAVTVDFDIDISPNNSTVQDAIETAINEFFATNSEPATTIYLSQLSEVISSATGEQYHVLNTPSSDIVIAADEIAVVGTFTFGDA